jgi:hypothetical protein
MTRRAGVAQQKGQNKDNVAPRTPKGPMFGKKCWKGLECNNDIRDRGLRQKLQSKKEFTMIYRKTIGLDIAKQIAGSSVALQKNQELDIVEGSSPFKTEDEPTCGLGVRRGRNVGAPATQGSFAQAFGKKKKNTGWW